MPRLRLTLDKLWAHNIPDAVHDENSSGQSTLLCCVGHVRHADTDRQAHDRPECADDRVTSNGRGRVVRPAGFPDHGTAGNDKETIKDEKWNANVREMSWEPATDENFDETDSAQGEQEEDGVEWRPAERTDNERAKAKDGNVDCVCGRHYECDEPYLDV